MVFDIGDLHVKGREWIGREGEEKGPTSNGLDRKGRETGRDRVEREKTGRGAACPNNKKSFTRTWPVSINLAARLKCYRDVLAPN